MVGIKVSELTGLYLQACKYTPSCEIISSRECCQIQYTQAFFTPNH